MKRFGRGLRVLAIGALIAGLAGCGARSPYAETAAETTAAAMAGGVGASYMAAPEMSRNAKMAAPAAEMAEEALYDYDEAAADAGITGEPVVQDFSGLPADRKLIRTVNLGYETTEFDGFTAVIKEKTAEKGGYIESSDFSKNGYENDSRYAFYVLRIPQDRLDEFLLSLDGSANLMNRSENTQDITLEYHDIEGRKAALETEYETLLRLMEEAESMDAVIALNQRLSEIRYQLDAYGSNLRRYDNQVQYATVTVSVQEKREITPTAEATAWDRIRLGFVRNLRDVGSVLSGLGILLLSSIPTLVVTGLFAAIIVFAVRKIRRRAGRNRKQDPQ